MISKIEYLFAKGDYMADFCLDCYNKMNGTNYRVKDVTLDDELDLCEGCGEWKPCVLRLEPSGFLSGLFDWIKNIGL